MSNSRRNLPLLLAQSLLLFLAACAPQNKESKNPTTKPECDTVNAYEVVVEKKLFDQMENSPNIEGLALVSWGSVVTPTVPTLEMLPLEGTPVVQSLFDIDPESVHMYGAASIPLSDGYTYGVPVGMYFIPKNQLEVTLTLWEENGVPLFRKTQEATNHMVCIEPVAKNELEGYPSGLRAWLRK